MVALHAAASDHGGVMMVAAVAVAAAAAAVAGGGARTDGGGLIIHPYRVMKQLRRIIHTLRHIELPLPGSVSHGAVPAGLLRCAAVETAERNGGGRGESGPRGGIDGSGGKSSGAVEKGRSSGLAI